EAVRQHQQSQNVTGEAVCLLRSLHQWDARSQLGDLVLTAVGVRLYRFAAVATCGPGDQLGFLLRGSHRLSLLVAQSPSRSPSEASLADALVGLSLHLAAVPGRISFHKKTAFLIGCRERWD